MKDRAGIETRLRNELIHWQGIQSRDITQDFYLYYQESTPSRDGSLIICREQPRGHSLATPERINKTATIQQNFNRLRQDVMSLPILSIL